MRKSTIILVLALAAAAESGRAETDREDWQRVYELSYVVDLLDIWPLDDGGAYVAGTVLTGPGDRSNGLLMRIGPDGAPIWHRTFGDDAEDALLAVMATPNGDVVSAGIADGFLPYFIDFTSSGRGWLLRVDSDGDTLTEQRHWGLGVDGLGALAALPDGGALVGGYREVPGSQGIEGWLFRLDAGGAVLWQRALGSGGTDNIRDIALLDDGGIIVAGSAQGPGAGSDDGWLVRLDAEGTVLWERRYGLDKTDLFRFVLDLDDAGFVAGGYTEGRGSGGDGWLVGVDPDGSPLWESTFGGTGFDSFADAIALPNGHILAVGNTRAQSVEDPEGWLARIRSDGTLVREEVFGADGWDELEAIAALPDGGVLLAGSTAETRDANSHHGGLVLRRSLESGDPIGRPLDRPPYVLGRIEKIEGNLVLGMRFERFGADGEKEIVDLGMFIETGTERIGILTTPDSPLATRPVRLGRSVVSGRELLGYPVDILVPDAEGNMVPFHDRFIRVESVRSLED